MENLMIEILGQVRNTERLIELLKEAYDKVPLHWKRLLPNFKVIIVGRRFDEISALGDVVAEINEIQWKRNRRLGITKTSVSAWEECQAVTRNGSQGKEIFVRMPSQSIDLSPEYEFKKDFLAEIAGLLMTSSNLSEVAHKNATGLARRSVILALTAFRSSFKRFFINPKWLAEEREDAYYFMCELDRLAQEGIILPAAA